MVQMADETSADLTSGSTRTKEPHTTLQVIIGNAKRPGKATVAASAAEARVEKKKHGKAQQKQGQYSDEQLRGAVRIMVDDSLIGRDRAATVFGCPKAAKTVERRAAAIRKIRGENEEETARLRSAAIDSICKGGAGGDAINNKKVFDNPARATLAEHIRLCSQHGFPLDRTVSQQRTALLAAIQKLC